MEKRICLIYANCQNALIANYLRSSEFFNQEYIIKRLAVHSLIASEKSISDKILQQTKLFIYQPVKDIHGKRSSNYLLEKLPPDCQKVSFPSLYFKGYFPQYCKNPTNHIIEPRYRYGIIPHGDSNIISMLEQGANETKIIEKLRDPDFYTSDAIKSNLNETLEVLSQRESQLDVKVSEFIKANYQQYQLFYTQNHPTNILGMHVVNQILQLINLPILGDPLSVKSSLRGVLSNYQIPIYPSVTKHLNLKFATSKDTYYGHASFCTNRMTFDRYISEYIELHNSNSESANAHYFKAIKLLEKDRYDQANIAIKQAIRLKPNNAAYYKELATILQKQNNLEKAETVYRKAIELSPYWDEFYQLLGNILVKKKDLTSAMLAFNQATILAPDCADYYFLLGNTLAKLNKLDEAQNCLQKAIDLY